MFLCAGSLHNYLQVALRKCLSASLQSFFTPIQAGRASANQVPPSPIVPFSQGGRGPTAKD